MIYNQFWILPIKGDYVMKTISLNGIWSLKGRDQTGVCKDEISITAEVPGCVQLDLSRHGYLPQDLYMGDNIRQTEKYEGYEWWYERHFDCPRDTHNVYLVFEGVDCLAEYYLNGKKIGISENMFIPMSSEWTIIFVTERILLPFILSLP